MIDAIETAFLDWQVTLEEEKQEEIAFDHFDGTVKIVFLKRSEEFDRKTLKKLQKAFTKIHPSILISTIKGL